MRVLAHLHPTYLTHKKSRMILVRGEAHGTKS